MEMAKPCLGLVSIEFASNIPKFYLLFYKNSVNSFKYPKKLLTKLHTRNLNGTGS